MLYIFIANYGNEGESLRTVLKSNDKHDIDALKTEYFGYNPFYFHQEQIGLFADWLIQEHGFERATLKNEDYETVYFDC